MLHTTMDALLSEIHALAFLALKTNRSLIIPNILIGRSKLCLIASWIWLTIESGIGRDLPGGQKSGNRLFDYRENAKNAKVIRPIAGITY